MPSPGVAVDVLTSAPSTATAETAAAAAQIAANLQAQYGLTASAEAPASSLAADALGGGGHQGIQQALSVSPPPPPPPPAGHPLPPPLSEDMPSWLSPRTEHIKNPLGMGADPRSSKSIRLNNIPHGISSSDVSAFCARTFGNVTKCSTSVDQTSSGVSAIVEFELQHSVQMAMRMQTVFLAGQRVTVVPVATSQSASRRLRKKWRRPFLGRVWMTRRRFSCLKSLQCRPRFPRRAGLAVGGLAREDPGPGGQVVVSGAEGAVGRMTASGRAV